MLNKEISSDENRYDDFIDLFKMFIEEYSNFLTNDDVKKIFRIDSNNMKCGETETFRYLFFYINSGGYGIESNIINTSNNKVVYVRKKENAEVMDFRVFIALPKGENVYKGIIFFQNIGQFGIKTITTEYLKKFISEKLGYMSCIGNICPQIFAKKILECNGIKKIIYSRNNVSNDSADIEKIGYGKEERVITGLSNITKWTEIIFSYLNGKNHTYEFEDVDYTGLKLVTSVYGRQRTININNIDSLSVIEGIPDDILNEIGDIDDQKLINHFITVTKEYLESMVYQR